MVIVGLDYGFAGQTTVAEVTGGSPYGATAIAVGDGSRQPSENELAGARYQGKRIAEIARTLSSHSPTRERESLVHAMSAVRVEAFRESLPLLSLASDERSRVIGVLTLFRFQRWV